MIRCCLGHCMLVVAWLLCLLQAICTAGCDYVEIYSSIKAVKERALMDCQLRIVILNGGLEEIGLEVFGWCRSIWCIINIPNAIKAIKEGAFRDCSRLSTVTLNDGLEEIGKEAFGQCTLLEQIIIPNTVKMVIKDWAFSMCEGLMTALLATGWRRLGTMHFALATHYKASSYPTMLRELWRGHFVSAWHWWLWF